MVPADIRGFACDDEAIEDWSPPSGKRTLRISAQHRQVWWRTEQIEWKWGPDVGPNIWVLNLQDEIGPGPLPANRKRHCFRFIYIYIYIYVASSRGSWNHYYRERWTRIPEFAAENPSDFFLASWPSPGLDRFVERSARLRADNSVVSHRYEYCFRVVQLVQIYGGERWWNFETRSGAPKSSLHRM
jgi:hypothetical protein